MSIFISDDPECLNAVYVNVGHPLVTLEKPNSEDDAIWFHFPKKTLECLIKFAKGTLDDGDDELHVLFSGDIVLRKNFDMSVVKGQR